MESRRATRGDTDGPRCITGAHQRHAAQHALLLHEQKVFFGAWQFIKKKKKKQILAGSSNLSICFCKIFSRCHVDQPGRRCFNNFTIVWIQGEKKNARSTKGTKSDNILWFKKKNKTFNLVLTSRCIFLMTAFVRFIHRSLFMAQCFFWFFLLWLLNVVLYRLQGQSW